MLRSEAMAKAERVKQPTLVDPLSSLVGYQLRRASSALFGTLVPRLAEHGLSIAEASVLVVIAHHDGITQSSVGRMLDIHRANMAPIAAKLSRLGFTLGERRGRELLVRVSESGARVAKQVLSSMRRHDAAHIKHLSAAERDALVRTLQRLWAPA